jgi:hypothetical protein
MVENKELVEEFEENSILMGMLVSDEFLNHILTIDILKYLPNQPAKLLASWIITYHEKYGKCPGSSVAELINSQKKIINPIVNKFINKIVDYVAERYGDDEEEFDLPYALDTAQKYIQSRALLLRREEEEKLLDVGDVLGAYKLVTSFEIPTILEDNSKIKLVDALPTMTKTFSQLEDMEFPNKEYILGGDFPLEKGSITLIVGAAGSGKTWFTCELAKMISGATVGLSGTCKANDVTKTLIVDGELPIHEIRERSKILQLEDYPHLSIISKLLLEREDVTPSLNLTSAIVRDTLTDYIVDNKFELVILDNLFSLYGGLDLNSAEEWEPINSWMLKLRAKDISVILSHHLSKAGAQFGSVSRLFNINNCLTIKKETPNDGDDNCCCFSISIEKQRGTGIHLQGKKFIFRNKIWTTEPFSGKVITKTTSPKTQPKPIPKPVEPTPRPSLRSGLRDKPTFRVYKKEE